MTFPHEGCLITIDQLSYHDPPSHTSPIRPISYVAYVESMHYMSITTVDTNPTPIECEPTTLVPPPHHPSLEVSQVHSPLGEPTSCFSPIYESNFVFSPIVIDDINSLYGPQHPPRHSSSPNCLNSSTIGPGNFISLGSSSLPRSLLVSKKDGTFASQSPMQDIDQQPMFPTPTTIGVAQTQ